MKCRIVTKRRKFNTPDLREEQKPNLIKENILDSYKITEKEDYIRDRFGGYDPRHDSSDIFYRDILGCKTMPPMSIEEIMNFLALRRKAKEEIINKFKENETMDINAKKISIDSNVAESNPGQPLISTPTLRTVTPLFYPSDSDAEIEIKFENDQPVKSSFRIKKSKILECLSDKILDCPIKTIGISRDGAGIYIFCVSLDN